MAMRAYGGDATFQFRLQTGDWPSCDVDLTEAYQTLQAALVRDGFSFAYEDVSGQEVQVKVQGVTAPVPCGDMPAEPEMPGAIRWLASAPPRPGQSWGLGEALAGWLSAVPVVLADLTFMVGLEGLTVWESAAGAPGPLWPNPDALTDAEPIV